MTRTQADDFHVGLGPEVRVSLIRAARRSHLPMLLCQKRGRGDVSDCGAQLVLPIGDDVRVAAHHCLEPDLSATSGSDDLHGNAPDHSSTAVVLVDVINDFDFEGGAALLENAAHAVHEIAALTHVARSTGIPVVYVNDNRGKWRSRW
jgi:hypothetical protein